MTSEAELIKKVWREGYTDAVIDAGIGKGPAAQAALNWAASRAEQTGLFGIAEDLRTWAAEAAAE